jgi:hypothetical protein
MHTSKKLKLLASNFPIIFKQLPLPKKIIVTLAGLGITFGIANLFIQIIDIFL